MTTEAIGSREDRWSHAYPIVAAAAGAVALAGAARLPAPTGPKLAAVEVGFVSLFAEALPFLLAGAVISALLRGAFGRRLLRAAAGRPRLAAALAPLTGLALPLCDCGMLPIAREMRDGGARRAVNAFIAGAPLTNPLVIISTLVAFPGEPEMAAGRVAAGLMVAMVVGALAAAPALAKHDHHGHDHHDHDHAEHARGGAGALLDAVGSELSRTAPALALGALLAAVIRGFIPPEWLTGLASQPLVAAVAMMALAFIMSICSTADAFVAASLPVGAMPRLAFLVMGPILDLRLAVLYMREFGRRWLGGYAVIAVPMVLVAVTVCAVIGLS